MKFLVVSFFLAVFTAVSAPSIISPANGIEIVEGSYDLLFSFSGTSGGTYVEIWIDNNSGFGSPEIGYDNGKGNPWLDDGIVSASGKFNLTITMQNRLPQNVYYAKARLLNASKSPIGSWGSTISFSVLDWRNTPAISSPKNRIEIIKDKSDLDFVISGLSGADKAEIWIDNHSGFGSPEIGFDNGKANPWVEDGIFSASSGYSLSKSSQKKLFQNLYFAKVRLISYKNTPVSSWSSVVDFVLKEEVIITNCILSNLSINQINIDYLEKSGSVSFDVDKDNADCAWEIVSSQSWIQITSSLTGNGNGDFTYTVLENSSEFLRQGKITITTKDDIREIAVSQTGHKEIKPADLMLFTSSADITAGGGNINISLKNAGEEDLSWVMTGYPVWITPEKTMGLIEAGLSEDVLVVVAENTSVSARQAQLRFENVDDASDYEIFTINQLGIKTVPVAEIVSITPAVAKIGESVSFSGDASDADGGDVFDYQWLSNFDGDIGNAKNFSITTLSEGEHIIILKVCDDEGVWSDTVLGGVKIEKAEPVFVKGFDKISEFKTPLNTTFSDETKQCPYYTRLETGINIFGDAHTWYEQAISKKYPVGRKPIAGSIVVFAKTDKLKFGHVGIVADIDGSNLDVRDYSWWTKAEQAKGIPRMVKRHYIDTAVYKVAGYIYYGNTIPEFGSSFVDNSLADTTIFSVDLFVTASNVSSVVDTNIYGIMRAEVKKDFNLTDSVIFFAQSFYARDSVLSILSVKKDGEDYYSDSIIFNTNGGLFPYYYPIFGYRFDDYGKYDCSFFTKSREREIIFNRSFEIKNDLVGIKDKLKIKVSAFLKKREISIFLTKNERVEIFLVDLKGRLIWDKSGDYPVGSHSFALKNIASGIYFLNFKLEKEKRLIKINL